MQPRVSIVITTYKEEAKPYLDLCMESIGRLNYPKELIDVVLVSRPDYAPKYDGVMTVYPSERVFGTERAQNLGISFTDKASKFLFVLNDDVILTPDCLKNLVEVAGDNDGMFMPISPCDNYYKYTLHFPIQHKGDALLLTDRFYRIEQLAEFKEGLLSAQSIYPQGTLPADMLCTFACLYPRKTYEAVGPFDEQFDTGQSDFDYCLRLKRKAMPRVIALNSLVWHFGGVTSSATLTDARKSANARYYRKKWGEWPPDFDFNVLVDITNAELREFDFFGE